MTGSNNQAIKAVENRLGIVPGNAQNGEQIKRIPEKKTFVATTCGDLSVTFGSIAWPDENGEYGEPSPVYYAKVRGYKNSKGYEVEIPISDDPEDIRKFAKAMNSIADFIEKSGIGKLNRDYDVEDLDAAFAVFGKRKA